MTNINQDAAKCWKSIKSLAGLSNPPILLSLLLNGDVIKDQKLTEHIADSFSKVAENIPQVNLSPMHSKSTFTPDKYIITIEGVERLLWTLTPRNLSVLTIYETGY